MKIPGVERAEVGEIKIVKYLLSTIHRAGKSKAAFFMDFGFTPERWQELKTALRKHAQENEIAYQEVTPFGTRFVIDGSLLAPDGTLLNVRAAWFIDSNSDTPRFVTAHPLRRTRP